MTTGVGIRDEQNAREVAIGSSKPPPDRRASIGEGRIENGRDVTDASTSRFRGRKNEQTADLSRREPEPIPSHGPADDPNLLVELPDRRIDRGEIGLHLDDDHRHEIPPGRQNVDRTTLAELRVGDLDRDLPHERPQSTNHCRDDTGMRLIQESIEITSAPRYDGFPSRLDRCEHPAKRGRGQLRTVTSLDERNRLLREITPGAQLSLSQASPSSEGTQDAADPDVVHRPIIGMAAYVAVVGLSKRLARN